MKCYIYEKMKCYIHVWVIREKNTYLLFHSRESNNLIIEFYYVLIILVQISSCIFKISILVPLLLKWIFLVPIWKFKHKI